MSKCAAKIKEAFGSITLDQAEKIAQDARLRMSAMTDKLGAPDSISKQLEDMTSEAEIDLANRKRIAAINLEKKANMVELADNMIERGVPLHEVALAMVEGGNKLKWGAEFSLDNVIKTTRGKWLSALADKLDISNRPDLEKALKSGKHDLEIAEAMANIELGASNANKNPVAIEVAQVASDLMEGMRVEMVDQGAYIEKRWDWLLGQSHDSSLIRKAYKKLPRADRWKAWRDDVMEMGLDFQRTFGFSRQQYMENESSKAFVDKWFKGFYNNIESGTHIKIDPEAMNGGAGTPNIATRAARRRLLQFEDPTGHVKYMQTFGHQTIGNSLMAQIHGASRELGILQYAGPSHTKNIETVANYVEQLAKSKADAGEDVELRKLVNNKKTVREAINMVDGSYDVPEADWLAKTGAGLRTVQGISSLGTSTASQVADSVGMAQSSMAYGRGYLSGYADFFGSMFKSPETQRNRREVASYFGAYIEETRLGLMEELAAPDSANGLISKANHIFAKLSSINYVTTRTRTAAGLASQRFAGESASKGWADIHSALRASMSEVEIGEADWDVMRQFVETKTVGNETMKGIAVRAIEDAPPEKFAAIAKSNSPRALANARTELASKMRSWLQTEMDNQIIEPKTRLRRKILGANKRGSVEFEARATIGQFKSFPLSWISERIFRDFRRAKEGGGRTGMAAALFLQTTVMGYAAMVMKDIAKGVTPRDPKDYRTILAAIQQGGGLGIYGDFLFGETNRMGGGVASTFLGPTFGDIQSLLDIKQRAMDGEPLMSQLLQFGYYNTPGNNLYWARLGLDHLIYARIMDSIDPQFSRRRRQRLMRNNEQEMLLDSAGPMW